MTTAGDLIDDAAVKARIISPYDTWPNPNKAAALREMNRMLDSYANDNLIIYEQTEESFALTASQGSYTIGVSGSPDFNTVRPQEILEGTYVRVGSIDYPLRIKSMREYRKLATKSTASTPPRWLSYNPTYPNGTIYLWYEPNSTDSIYLISLKELGTFASLTTTVTLPPGYEDLLVYELALRLNPDYGKTVREDVAAFYRDLKNNIKIRNAARLNEPTELEIADLFGGGTYNDNIDIGPWR